VSRREWSAATGNSSRHDVAIWRAYAAQALDERATRFNVSRMANEQRENVFSMHAGVEPRSGRGLARTDNADESGRCLPLNLPVDIKDTRCFLCPPGNGAARDLGTNLVQPAWATDRRSYG